VFRRSACLALRQVRLIVDWGVELELDRRALERLVARAVSPAFGPMRPHFVRPAGSVGDAAVKRLYRQPAFRALTDQRVEAPAEPVDLDDVACSDSLESHRWQAYARARRFPPTPTYSCPPAAPTTIKEEACAGHRPPRGPYRESAPVPAGYEAGLGAHSGGGEVLRARC
jgi:hypothetical protein